MSTSSLPVEITVRGMHCTNCALGLEKHLRKLGAEEVSVDFSSSTASFLLKEPATLESVKSEIERLGYVTADSSGRAPFLDSMESKFIFSILFTAPLLLHSIVPIHVLHNPNLQLALAIPVFALGALHFGKSALTSLRTGLPNMDVLIVIGIFAAFIYSVAGMALGLGSDFLFFETAATITSIVLLGNVLEERSVRRTTSAIEELSGVQVSKAKAIVSQLGKESIVEVDVETIREGQKFIVNTGDKVPIDGEIYWGDASVDESMISGESVPVEKEIGASVIGGTVVVKGSIKIRATAIGDHTILANMIKLVRQAQSKKPRIQRISDKVGAAFVPIVLSISIITFIISFFFLGIGFQIALLRSIAVLVVACPCAMGLATPTAVMVGVGQAAKNGILIKGGDTLEKLAHVKTLVFDKTGTLTTGKFKIKGLKIFRGEEARIRSILKGLEEHSSHPIAKSLVAELSSVTAHPFKEVTEKRGVGIEGNDQNGITFSLASAASSNVKEEIKGHEIYLFEDETPIAGIDLEDALKVNAAMSIAKLKAFGIEPVLLSGDAQSRCDVVGASLGISKIYGGKLPDQKLTVLEGLQATSLTAFVGDGVNDAPALSRAAVGISLSNATEAAIQSSQVILLNGDLEHLVSAIAISRLTLRTIKENLFWAFIYNAVSIPVAAAGYLSPLIGCLSMALSDVIVVANSLKLRSKKILS